MAISTAAASPALAQAAPATPPPVDYKKNDNWLCLPGRSDICARPVTSVDLTPKGYGAVRTSRPAPGPAIDCFYIYPTVSRDRGLNSDLVMGEEHGFTHAQLAPFAPVCRTFAPKYRQMTVAAIAAFAMGQDITRAAALSYGDVLAAWRDYLANRNRGRPFVLIGHSQGSVQLIQLIASEIEKDPRVAARMKLAILAGFNVEVPQGKRTGGTFKSTPLCSSGGDVNCVIAWNSFRERNAPPAGAMFGVASRPGMTVACVNPAAPGSRGPVPLDSIWTARSDLPVPGGPIDWSSEGPPKAPFVRTPGLASGQCVTDGQRGYLSIRTNADPADKRTDRIGGEVAVLGMFIPGWGMHLADFPLVQGNLVERVGRIERASR